jgi:RNA polymerase sigma-70 factor (ECF subfamily)
MGILPLPRVGGALSGALDRSIVLVHAAVKFRTRRASGASVNATAFLRLIHVMTGLPIPAVELPELVARTREGDERAFAALVGTYRPFVFRWAIALSGDVDEAEDITQEVFVRVYRKLGSFRGDGPFEGWLYRITCRVASRSAPRRAHDATSTTLEVYVTDPGARVDRQRAVELIQAIARTLPPRQREVFILCDLDGRTPGEAAAILEMKDVSVRASLFKARAAIRRSILATHPCYRDQPQ